MIEALLILLGLFAAGVYVGMRVQRSIAVDRGQLLSDALRALIFTREYVGDEKLPAIDGWDWYDAARNIADEIPGDEWTRQLTLRTGYKPGEN